MKFPEELPRKGVRAELVMRKAPLNRSSGVGGGPEFGSEQNQFTVSEHGSGTTSAPLTPGCRTLAHIMSFGKGFRPSTDQTMAK